ncbi:MULTISPECIES: DUF6274 family protein [Streptomyces]|uniref:DUF6274 family protein n=1 Tax=Streptomyces fimbriatus TaxID=68197 RepID=A0ABW0DIW5_STRFI
MAHGGSGRHETRALLRAHLAAASSYRHLTRHCPICHHLLRLVLDSAPRSAASAEDGRGTDTRSHEPGSHARSL